MKTQTISLTILLLATPALAEPLARVAPAAYCRDEKGHVRLPHQTPPLHAEARRVNGGMIKLDAKIAGEDCFLYRNEAALTEIVECTVCTSG